MKKILLLALALILVFSLAACASGNGGSKATDPQATKGGNDNNNGNSSKADITTVEGWLSYWGLSEKDLKCANFNRLDKTVSVSNTGEIKEVSAYVSQKLTNDEIRAWLEQVMSKLNSLSENGKVERFSSGGEALTADYMMGEMLHIGQGTYPYKGKTVYVMISVPGGLDKEDPNDASAFCSLKLEWN